MGNHTLGGVVQSVICSSRVNYDYKVMSAQ